MMSTSEEAPPAGWLAGDGAGAALAGDGAGAALAGDGAGAPLAGDEAGAPLAGDGAGAPFREDAAGPGREGAGASDCGVPWAARVAEASAPADRAGAADAGA